MGQRHQIFVKAFTGERDNNTTVAFHHQWLFGATAIRQLRNMLEFNQNVSKYHQLNNKEYTQMRESDVEKVVDTCFSMNVKEGYFSSMINLRQERADYEGAMNPDYQDNNDGQTFIDFTGDKVKYCYTFPFDRIIDEDSEEGDIAITKWEPLTPTEYIKQYYDITVTGEDAGEEEFFETIRQDIKWIEDNFEVMTQEDFYSLYPDLKS